MITVIYTYDVLPGKMEEFGTWLEAVGIPFWTGRPEVRSVRICENLFGGLASPNRTVILEFEDMGACEGVWESEEAKGFVSDLRGMIANVKVSYMKNLLSHP